MWRYTKSGAVKEADTELERAATTLTRDNGQASMVRIHWLARSGLIGARCSILPKARRRGGRREEVLITAHRGNGRRIATRPKSLTGESLFQRDEQEHAWCVMEFGGM